MTGSAPTSVLGVYIVRPSTASFDFCDFVADLVSFARSNGVLPVSVLLLRESEKLSRHDEFFRYHDADELEWRLWNLLVPIAARSDAVDSVHVGNVDAMPHDLFNAALVFPPGATSRLLVEWDRSKSESSWRNAPFSCFSASSQALSKVALWLDAHEVQNPVVAISIRERAVEPERNSSIADWLLFCRYLLEHGFSPILIPDTSNPWPGWMSRAPYLTMPEASLSVDVRLALYEMAYCSMFYSNGPAAMALLDAKVNSVVFLPRLEETEYANSLNYAKAGLRVGSDRLDFPRGLNLLVWETDSFPSVVSAFERFKDEQRLRTDGRRLKLDLARDLNGPS